MEQGYIRIGEIKYLTLERCHPHNQGVYKRNPIIGIVGSLFFPTINSKVIHRLAVIRSIWKDAGL